jgi:hypothetical protein
MSQGVQYIHAIIQNYGLCGTFFAMAVSYTYKIFYHKTLWLCNYKITVVNNTFAI